MGMQRNLRIGVIGAGSFASRRHIPDIVASPDAELVALCRRDPQKLKQMAAHFGVEKTFTDYEQMLQEVEMDGVLIATPHALHYEQAKCALENGLHVLVEKPMVLTSSEGQDLVATARSKRKLVVVALNPPYWRHTSYVRDLIRSGRLGRVESLVISWLANVQAAFGRAPMPERMPGVVPPTLFRADPALCGGGHFMDSGTHLACETIWTTGLDAVRVSALMDDLPVDMRCAVCAELEGGVPATINTAGDSPMKQRRLHNIYFGSEATLHVEGLPFRVTLVEEGKAPVTISEEEMDPVPSPVQDFIAAISGRTEPRSPAELGLKVVKVVEAAYESARTGQTVALSRG